MVNKIEVYVRKKKQIIRQYVTPPVWDGYQHHACMSKEVTELKEVLSDPDAQALKAIERLAAETGVSFRVYDVAAFVGKLRAKSRGITETPLVIMNGERITDIRIELLRSKLHA